jgi:hypothetical protein
MRLGPGKALATAHAQWRRLVVIVVPKFCPQMSADRTMPEKPGWVPVVRPPGSGAGRGGGVGGGVGYAAAGGGGA